MFAIYIEICWGCDTCDVAGKGGVRLVFADCGCRSEDQDAQDEARWHLRSRLNGKKFSVKLGAPCLAFET